MMNKRTIGALVALLGCILALVVFIRHGRAPKDVAPVASATRQDALRQSLMAIQPIKEAPRDQKVPAQASQSESPEMRQFKLYRSVMAIFNRAQADRLGITSDEQLALDTALWDVRQKMNRMIAEHGVIRHTDDGVVIVSFQLDSGTSKALRDDFIAEARRVVGVDRWAMLEANQFMSPVDAHMDYWGEYPTAYSFEYVAPDKPGHDAVVKFDWLSEKNPTLMFNASFSEPVFATLFEPIAQKIGF